MTRVMEQVAAPEVPKLLTFLFFDQIVSNLGGRSHSRPNLTFWSNFDILAILTPFLVSNPPKWGQNGQFLTFRDFRPKLWWWVIHLAQIDNLAKFCHFGHFDPFFGGSKLSIFWGQKFFFRKNFRKIFRFFFFQKSTQNTQNDMLRYII